MIATVYPINLDGREIDLSDLNAGLHSQGFSDYHGYCVLEGGTVGLVSTVLPTDDDYGLMMLYVEDYIATFDEIAEANSTP